MASASFRHLSQRSGADRADRLVRAAIEAFCSLPRPSRAEIRQFEDLVEPVYQGLSVETRRFAAAALSENPYVPPETIRRIANEPVEISAPLLIRSVALADVDLIALIGRHGIPHARAIARRSNLNPVIEKLIRSLLKAPPASEPRQKEPAVPEDMVNEPVRTQARTPGFGAEAARHRLRTMMEPAETLQGAQAEKPRLRRLARLDPDRAPEHYRRLRQTALLANPALFHTALADTLEIGFDQARGLLSSGHYAELSLALKSLALTDEQAYLIVSTVLPSAFGSAEAVRLFLDRYGTIHPEAARDRVRDWRVETLSASLRARAVEAVPHHEAANSEVPSRQLKAS